MIAARRLITRTPLSLVRGLSTKSILPPNLAAVGTHPTPSGNDSATASKEPANLDDLVYIYQKLPKGPAPAPSDEVTGPFTWYYRRYLSEENISYLPIVHLIGFLFGFGYILEYNSHLAHHKNVKYH